MWTRVGSPFPILVLALVSNLHWPCPLHTHHLVWWHLQTLTTHRCLVSRFFLALLAGSQMEQSNPPDSLKQEEWIPQPAPFSRQLPLPWTLASHAFLAVVSHEVCSLFRLVAESPQKQLCGMPEEVSVGFETIGYPFCKLWGVSLLGWLFGERHLFLPRRRSRKTR